MSSNQSVFLIKQDKILRSQIVKKIREEISNEQADDQKLTEVLGFSFEDVNHALQ